MPDMLTPFFRLFSYIDELLRSFMPLWGVLFLWGLLGGAAVMGLYALVSPQKRISAKKEEIKQLQALLKDESLDFAGTLRLTKQNIMRSLELLGVVLLPSFVSMAPALAMIFFVSILYTHQAPVAGQELEVEVSPYINSLRVESGGGIERAGDNTVMVGLSEPPQIVFYEGDRMIYEWASGMPMDGFVGKRPWWGMFAPDGAGYLPEDSGVSGIRIGFQRLMVAGWLPGVLGGWEFTYFLALTISAVALKVAFRIH